MDPIRYAVVGCGSIAKNYHLPALTALPDAEFAIACDTVEEAARQTADRFGAPDWCTDVEDVVCRDDVQLVCVFTKIDSHADLAVRAARAGKHVFMQKPFARTLREGRAIIAAAASQRVLLVTSFMHSFFDESLAAAEHVRAGAVGRIEFVRMRNACGNPRQSAPSYGGAMMDIGAHGIALIRAVTGQETRRVMAKLDVDEGAAPIETDAGADPEDRPLRGNELNAFLWYELDSGALVSHEVQWSQRGGTSRFQMEIYGTEGSVLVRIPQTESELAVVNLTQKPGGESRRFTWTHPDLPGRPTGFALHRELIDRIRRCDVENPGGNGFAVLRVCEAARRSAESQTWADVLPG